MEEAQPRSPLSTGEGWHLVGQSEDERSERSHGGGAVSRPLTPTVSLMAGEQGEAERRDAAATEEAGAAAVQEHQHPLDAGSALKVAADTAEHMPVLQEAAGPANSMANVPAAPSADTAGASAPAPQQQHQEQHGPQEGSGGGSGVREAGGLMLLADGWQGLDTALQLAGVEAFMELLEGGLGWTRGGLLEVCRAGVQGLQQCLARTHQAVALSACAVVTNATLARAQLAQLLARAHHLALRAHRPLLPLLPRAMAAASSSTSGGAAKQEQGGGEEGCKEARTRGAKGGGGVLRLTLREGLLVSALGLTTLTSLVGLVYFMGRCRQLTAQLQQRDRELARLVVKILNLQDALQQPRVAGVPVLRHTLLSGFSLV